MVENDLTGISEKALKENRWETYDEHRPPKVQEKLHLTVSSLVV